MLTTIDDLVIFTTPILSMLFAAVIVCIIIENVFFVHGVFCVIAASLTVGLLVSSIVYGVKYQELLIALIMIAMAQMISLTFRVKGDEKSLKKDDSSSMQNTTNREVKN